MERPERPATCATNILAEAARRFQSHRSCGFWRYFRGRGITDETVEAFGLGYVPDHACLTHPPDLVPAFLAAGLFDPVQWRRQRRLTPAFSGMLAFPLPGPSGGIESFIFRSTRRGHDGRFLNLPNTPDDRPLPGPPYQVRKPAFYGPCDVTDPAVKCVTVVEGASDMLRCVQAGLPTPTCTSGGGTSDSTILDLLAVPDREVTLFLDWDMRGVRRTLALAAMDHRWRLERPHDPRGRLWVVSPPPSHVGGKDPADLESDAEIVDVFHTHRVPAETFLDQLLASAIDVRDPWQRAVAAMFRQRGGMLARPVSVAAPPVETALFG